MRDDLFLSKKIEQLLKYVFLKRRIRRANAYDLSNYSFYLFILF